MDTVLVVDGMVNNFHLQLGGTEQQIKITPTVFNAPGAD
jgi:hypothetical protein